MDAMSQSFINRSKTDGANSSDICPALVLADKVMCDALEQLYQPSSRQIREYCTKKSHNQCSLRRSV
jgi:hypothetical protein